MDLTEREHGVLEQLEMLIRQGRSEGEAARTLTLLTDEEALVARCSTTVAPLRRNVATSQVGRLCTTLKTRASLVHGSFGT